MKERASANDEAMDWEKAREHFEAVKIEGVPGVTPTSVYRRQALARQITFDPLRIRFNRGERSRSLYDAMMGVE